MKFQITMKDPDGCYDCMKQAAEDSVASLDVSDEEKDLLIDSRESEVKKACSKWFRYGEYLTVEVDTEANTCTVVANH